MECTCNYMFVFAFNYCTCALLINFIICFASCYHKNNFHLFTRRGGGGGGLSMHSLCFCVMHIKFCTYLGSQQSLVMHFFLLVISQWFPNLGWLYSIKQIRSSQVRSRFLWPSIVNMWASSTLPTGSRHLLVSQHVLVRGLPCHP